MRPSNTNPYRLWSCLPALPNLGNRQRQQLRREGKRQRDTYEETDELERERWTYIFIERERERGEERRFHNAATLCRHFHESFERLPRWPFLACTPNRKNIAFIETHRLIMTAGCHWRRKWSSRHCTLKNRAQSSSAPHSATFGYLRPSSVAPLTITFHPIRGHTNTCTF